MTMSKAQGEDDASSVRNLVNALSAAAPQDVFDVGARRMAQFGFDWCSICIARTDPYALVRFRCTIPSEPLDVLTSTLVRNNGRGDWVYNRCARANAPLWRRPDPTTLSDADEKEIDLAFGALGVRLVFAQPFSVPGLLGILTGYALCEHAEEAFADPSLRESVEKAARLIAAFYDAMSDEAGLDHPERVHGPKVRLSARQREALRLLAEGHQLARIAHEMGVAEAMARRHIAAARDRLGAKTREQALALAIRHRLL
jgi:DNA-binding CsgD family transcriptional regulator